MYKKILRQKQFHMTNCGWNGRQWNDNDECELGQDAHTCNIIRLTFSHKVAVRAMSYRFPQITHIHIIWQQKKLFDTLKTNMNHIFIIFAILVGFFVSFDFFSFRLLISCMFISCMFNVHCSCHSYLTAAWMLYS